MDMRLLEAREAEEGELWNFDPSGRQVGDSIDNTFIVRVAVSGRTIKRAVSELLAESHSKFSGKPCLVDGPYDGLCVVKEDEGGLHFRPSFKISFHMGEYHGDSGVEEYMVSFTDLENKTGFYEFLKKSAGM